MREIIVISVITLQTSCKLFLTLLHNSHFKDSFRHNCMKPCYLAYSYGSLKMHVLTDLNYLNESICKSYIEYENNFRKIRFSSYVLTVAGFIRFPAFVKFL